MATKSTHPETHWLLITVSTSVLILIISVVVFIASRNYMRAAYADGRIEELQEELERANIHRATIRGVMVDDQRKWIITLEQLPTEPSDDN